ncbi:MAG TPA: isochorismatase family cysteine hydrolase [Terriglobales bacterium]|nr:isochorismatase family cysteine hydrolase [Terriglobales bacterium]
MDRHLIFWDVDTQADFMLPEGKLYVPGAETIIPTLARLTSWAASHQVLVIADVDAHQPDDEEFSQYPPHCLAGTPGQKKIPETSLTPQFTIPNLSGAVLPDTARYRQIVIEKQRIDVFTNPNIEALLAQLGKPEIVLYGVVTEICVAAATRGLLDRGYHVTVVEDAIRHLDQEKGLAFLEEVRRRGGRIMAAGQLLSSSAAA